jgi:hypothetical protein
MNSLHLFFIVLLGPLALFALANSFSKDGGISFGDGDSDGGGDGGCD